MNLRKGRPRPFRVIKRKAGAQRALPVLRDSKRKEAQRPSAVLRDSKMTDFKKAAAALDPPIPEPDVEKLLPVMIALEAAFRPLERTLTPESDIWTGPEDYA
jgi:hypothetical protein